ncbi:hypothetical protein J2X55_002269 [Microbacterium sp. 1154]|nr:hypothetical protein [Microbacterium sp. 1154]
MRILTVRQPWAWAIIHGGKDVENRIRNIAGGYRGPVAIHVALSEDEDGWDDPKLRAAWSELPAIKVLGKFYRPLSPMWAELGHIIGIVDILDAHEGHSESLHALSGEVIATSPCSPWARPDTHHLVLANPRALTEPIPYRGALGLRRLDDDTTARILAQIGGEA